MAIYKNDIVDINLESGNIHRSFLAHTIGSGDNSANRFGVRTFRDGVPQDLSGATCQAVFMNAAGVNIALTSYGTVSGNEAYVTLPQACYSVEGQFTLAIKLVDDGVTVTTRIVDGVVSKTGVTGAVVPTSSVPTYQEILDVYDDMVDATAAANTAIAETFDASKAYPAGKYVIVYGVLYRLTADHAANVTWANTSKVETKIGDEVHVLESAHNNTIEGLLSQYNQTRITGIPPWKANYYLDTSGSTVDFNSPVSAGSMMYLVQNCDEGQMYRVRGYGGTYGRLWAFVDSSNNIISKADAKTTDMIFDLILVAPANAVKLVVNVNKNLSADNRGVWNISEKALNEINLSNAHIDSIEEKTNNNTSAILSNYNLTIISGAPPWVGNYYLDTSGSTVNFNSPVSAGTFVYLVTYCIPGDKFIINGEGGTYGRLWAFADANGNILEKDDENAEKRGFLITAPSVARYLIVNMLKSDSTRYVKRVENQVSTDYLLNDNYTPVRISGSPPWVMDYYLKTDGATVDLDAPVSASTMMYLVVNCKPGEVFKVKGKAGSAARLWAFADEEYNIIVAEDANVQVEKDLIAPPNARYLIVNEAQNLSTSNRAVYRYTKNGGNGGNNHIRFLALGNSYSADWCSYVPFILKEYGVTCEIYHYVRDRLTLRDLYYRWESASNNDVETDEPAGTYNRRIYHIDTRSMSAWEQIDNTSAKSLVELGGYDFITLQQSVHHVTDASSYSPWLALDINLINLSIDKDTPIAFVGTIVKPEDDHPDTCLYVNENTVMKNYPFSFIIPYGTAVFNARTNENLAEIGDSEYHNFWCSDNIHLQDGLPRYTAALAATQAIVNNIFKQKSILFNKIRITTDMIDAWGVIQKHKPVVGITDDNCFLVQQAAVLANRYPYEVTQINDTPDDPE